jgi:hypothetical protein
MTPRQRKLVGLAALVPGLAVYLAAAGALGEQVPNRWYLKLPYYLAAGIAWAFPAMALLRWADGRASKNRPPSETAS